MFEGIPIAQLTPSALLLLAVLMIFMGWLVPKRTYAEKSKEADQWRQAYELERTARSALDAQSRELLEIARTSESFISAVVKNSERIAQSGDT